MYLANASTQKPTPPTPRRPIVFALGVDVSAHSPLEALIRREGWEPVLTSVEEVSAPIEIAVPCCLILNLALTCIDGLDLLRQIKAISSCMPVISVADHSDVTLAVRAMKAGALEFFIKPFDEWAIIDAMRAAFAASEEELDRRCARRNLSKRFESLSKREREVMSLVVKGMMNKQVGGALDISEITVKAHRGRVMQKMGAVSFADLITMANELGLAIGSAI